MNGCLGIYIFSETWHFSKALRKSNSTKSQNKYLDEPNCILYEVSGTGSQKNHVYLIGMHVCFHNKDLV